jgi:hypothetical protein
MHDCVTMKKLSKLVSTKKIGKQLRRHPFGSVIGLLALGGAAVALGRNGNLRRLRDGAMRRLSSARASVKGALESPAAQEPARPY